MALGVSEIVWDIHSLYPKYTLSNYANEYGPTA